MKAILISLAVLIGSYAASWVTIFLVLTGGDLKVFWMYLRLAWTSPGETPALIQALSLIAAAIITATVYLLVLRKRSSGSPRGYIGPIITLQILIVARPAFADMGGGIVFPLFGLPIFQLIVAVILLAPRYMRGQRASATVIYAIAVVFAWLFNLAGPADSFADFWPTFFVPLVAAAGIKAYCRINR